MYCEHCGAQIPADARFCAGCGRSFQPGVARPSEGRVNRHLRLVGVLWLALGGLRLAGAAAVYLVGKLFLVHIPIPFMPERFLGGVMTFVASFLLLKAILAFVAGWGLLEHEAWARMLTLVLGFLALLAPPFGTALGVYTLWVLLPEQSEREYRTLAQTA
ncbi:MAG: zinc ribbon domain-containing protein [Acidobacteria bacterium]|nr:zinc ribbon domain-containing protein [Acidobacteriota bacterium]MBI3663214.1 zinc ribbon domain-containing protein [Acidobacteriota bacterium]